MIYYQILWSGAILYVAGTTLKQVGAFVKLRFRQQWNRQGPPYFIPVKKEGLTDAQMKTVHYATIPGGEL